MSIKGDELEAKIRKGYNLDADYPLEVTCHREGIYSLKMKWIDMWHVLINENVMRFEAPAGYRMSVRQTSLRSDDIDTFIKTFQLAADIMQRLESGELG